VLAWLLTFLERDFESSLAPLALLPLLTIRPPLNRDVDMIQWLQPVTTRLASDLLYFFGILHVREGNVLTFPEKRFLVEEACSGVQSLFFVLFLAVLIAVWHRRRLLVTVLLLGSSVGLAGVMNVLRIFTVAVSWDLWKLDLSGGVPHDILGYVCLGIAAGLVVSSDAFLEFLTAPMPVLDFAFASAAKSVFWNRRFSYPPREEPLTATEVDGGGVWSWGSAGMALAFLVLMACTASVQAVMYFRSAGGPAIVAAADEMFPEDLLPAGLHGLQKQGYEVEVRSVDHVDGQFSKVWTYGDDHLSTRVSCDYPFSDWHNLEQCYRGIGWTVDERRYVDRDGWVCSIIQMHNPDEGRHGTLLFSLFEEGGGPLDPPSESSTWVNLKNRVRKGNMSAIYQSQLFLMSVEAPADSVLQQMLDCHVDARDRMLASVQKAER